MTAPELSRRSFLGWSAAAGSAALVFSQAPQAFPGAKESPEEQPHDKKIVWSACTVNCGSRCPLRLVVEDGTITRVLPDNTGDNELGTQQIRACVRGRSIRHRIYNPDRLKKPLKRKPGTKRGDGEWIEISWDQALDEIADKMKQLIKDYGNESIYINYGTGTLGGTIARSWPPAETPFARLMNLIGGYLNHYADYSTAQITAAYPCHYGEWVASNSFDDIKNSKLQVLFGNNPLETRMSGGGETFVTQQSKRRHHVKTIVIDPRFSETSVALGDDWVALRPGTDAALVAGLAYVMIQENLHDQEFLDKYCSGFDEEHLPEGAPKNSSYRAYLEGKKDGVPKTPEWAARITGVPAQKITQLAREIGNAKPVAINQGWGPQRHANGENQARAIFTLAAMCGDIGVPGGGTGGREASYGLSMEYPFNTNTENPVETSISVFGWTDAVDHGAEMTKNKDGVRGKDKLDVPIKMIWQYAGNALTNQHADINRTTELLRDDTKAELIVVSDIQMTVSARYADYVLPDCSTSEQEDVIQEGSSGNMGYSILASQAIKPLYDCRPIYDVIADLADRFGVRDQFTEGLTQQQWVERTITESQKEVEGLPDYQTLKDMGVWKTVGESVIPLKEFRDDPVANKLDTPSGKIEIYSSRIAELATQWELPEGDKLTPLPEYVATWEGAEEAKRNEKYPLQCIGHHMKGRTHSSYGNVDWLRDDAHPQTAWINPIDAKKRGIKNYDKIAVFNDRGSIHATARVTPRIAPGVMSVPQGSWYNPDEKGIDQGASMNTLTSWHPSPLAKGNAQHTALVQVERIDK
ncbi:DMSO/selenate family reductase complex A subunit [uncultured Corynebacterium sp.]|uniref:DMSO/selenate family reductase complex A subunit n=1 Tax=uncultured Corynebacterium sp. TaxID=159447 RepID=UPI002623826C|nr:DMSO/selenate family reductase complex A subunit [uncultured Corynebacterium sp.]